MLTAAQVRLRWTRLRDAVAEAVREAVRRPELTTAEQVLAPLAPRTPAAVAAAPPGGAPTTSAAGRSAASCPRTRAR